MPELATPNWMTSLARGSLAVTPGARLPAGVLAEAPLALLLLLLLLGGPLTTSAVMDALPWMWVIVISLQAP